jgi:hypothetical protein
MSLSHISEAYGPLLSSHWEKQEMPQHHAILGEQYVHSAPKRHMMGLIGGNEVSLIKGNLVDLESDLKGIHLPLTHAPWRQYQPQEKGQKEIVRDNVKNKISIDTTKAHLPVYQMMAYPAVMAPLPMKSEVCMKPEKY